MLKKILPGQMGSKTILSILIFSVIFNFIYVCETYASQVDERFEKGNSFYREGEFEKAIEEYKSLVDEGYLSTSLFYNLGNAYYRVGKIGYAILYYEKAHKLSPSDDDITHNINFAYLSTVDRIQPLPKFFLFEWWEELLSSFTVNGWAYIVFIFYLVLIILIALYFFASSVSQQRLIFFSGIATLLIFALTISLLVIKVNREATLKSGVIVEQVVTVKSSPDPNSTDSFIIHEGLKVNLEDSLDNWVKIRLADGKVGWVENNTVEQI
jgi:tetratricopeptide (TPR) repeat protein